MLMYAQDNDEILPTGNWIATNVRWSGLIQPYLKNTHVFTCPSAPDLEYHDANGPTGGYGYNSCSLGLSSLPVISKPSDTILLGESCGVRNTNPFSIRPDAATTATWCNDQTANRWVPIDAVPVGTPCPAPGQSSYPPEQRHRVAYRHNEHANIAFLDGHAKALRHADINRQADAEEGTSLTGRFRFVLWNRY